MFFEFFTDSCKLNTKFNLMIKNIAISDAAFFREQIAAAASINKSWHPTHTCRIYTNPGHPISIGLPTNYHSHCCHTARVSPLYLGTKRTWGPQQPAQSCYGPLLHHQHRAAGPLTGGQDQPIISFIWSLLLPFSPFCYCYIQSFHKFHLLHNFYLRMHSLNDNCNENSYRMHNMSSKREGLWKIVEWHISLNCVMRWSGHLESISVRW